MSIYQEIGLRSDIFRPCTTIEELESSLHELIRMTDTFIENNVHTYTNAKRVFWFGVSPNARRALKIYKELGIEPYAFCDNDHIHLWEKNAMKQRTQIDGLHVFAPDEIQQEKDVEIIITVSTLRLYSAIAQQMKSMGMPMAPVMKNYLYEAIVMNDTAKFFKSHLAEINKVYTLLADAPSRFTFLQTIKGRILDRELASIIYNSIMEGSQYWALDEFKNIKNAVFVDAGAFTGDTVAKFLYNNSAVDIDTIYAFEPDDNLFTLLEKNIDSLCESFEFPRHKIICHQVGVGMPFSSDIAVPRLTLSTVSLDEVIPGPVSFIKADIEGAESDMLDGAARIIKEYVPHMAICIYHSLEDLFRLPLKIHSLSDGQYTFAVRHHAPDYSETVLYCWKKLTALQEFI